MKILTLELCDEVISAVRPLPDEFLQELPLAEAAHWYSRGEISQEKSGDDCRHGSDRFRPSARLVEDLGMG